MVIRNKLKQVHQSYFCRQRLLQTAQGLCWNQSRRQWACSTLPSSLSKACRLPPSADWSWHSNTDSLQTLSHPGPRTTNASWRAASACSSQRWSCPSFRLQIVEIFCRFCGVLRHSTISNRLGANDWFNWPSPPASPSISLRLPSSCRCQSRYLL